MIDGDCDGDDDWWQWWRLLYHTMCLVDMLLEVTVSCDVFSRHACGGCNIMQYV